jgi:hypothetical protein
MLLFGHQLNTLSNKPNFNHRKTKEFIALGEYPLPFVVKAWIVKNQPFNDRFF